MRSAIAFVVAALSVGAVAQDTGLLLGVTDRDGRSSTVWIGTRGVAAFARKVGDGYWLWRDGGFWRVTEERTTGTNASTTVKLTDQNGKETLIKGEDGRPVTSFGVMFVSDYCLGLMQSMHKPATENDFRAGVGSGGFSSGGVTFPSVLRNYLWAEIGSPIEVGTAFGDAIKSQFDSSAQAAASMPGFHGLDREASPTNWTLRRDNGRWMLKGLLLPAQGDTTSSSVTEFEVAPVADKRFGTGNATGPKWARVKSEYPDATDFAVSPDGKLTVVVTAEEVFVHASSGSSLGRRMQRIRVDTYRVVMTQWLEGEAVTKVAAAVAKL